MRLKIRHETHYTYGRPATSALQILRLTPRSHDGQFVRNWRVEIDADSRIIRSEDAFGNIVHTFSADGPISTMNVVAEGEIDTLERAGLVQGTLERMPHGFWMRETALTRVEPGLRDYARSIVSDEGGDRLATLHQIMGAINRDFTFMVGETDAQTTAMDAFKRRTGVCQDLAHVFCACARTNGIPARYAGGYYLRTDTVEQEAGHAWAEAYIDNVGWIGFDPANGICVTDRHARVAVGQDYLDAAPIRGTRTGGSDEVLAVRISVSEGRMVTG
jgi:transglutaminase-like putative cysteine protease